MIAIVAIRSIEPIALDESSRMRVRRGVLRLLLVVDGFLRVIPLAWLIVRMYHVSGVYW